MKKRVRVCEGGEEARRIRFLTLRQNSPVKRKIALVLKEFDPPKHVPREFSPYVRTWRGQHFVVDRHSVIPRTVEGVLTAVAHRAEVTSKHDEFAKILGAFAHRGKIYMLQEYVRGEPMGEMDPLCFKLWPRFERKGVTDVFGDNVLRCGRGVKVVDFSLKVRDPADLERHVVSSPVYLHSKNVRRVLGSERKLRKIAPLRRLLTSW